MTFLGPSVVTVMSALQVYIGPDLEGTMRWVSGFWRLLIADIRRSAADGVMIAVMQGWQLQPGQFWEGPATASHAGTHRLVLRRGRCTAVGSPMTLHLLRSDVLSAGGRHCYSAGRSL